MYSYRELLIEWTYLQLHQRYQGSVLGFFWTLLYPLLAFLSFSVIFSILNNWDLRDFGLYFASGYVAWMFFANASQQAADSLPGHASFITRVYVPKALLPLSAIAIHLVDLLAGLVIIYALMPLLGAPYTLALLFLPVSLVLLVGFVAGVGLLCATVNVFLRDFRHLLSSVLFLWFFFSPILWKPDAMPPEVQPLLLANPITSFLLLFQDPIWRGAVPDAFTVLLSLAWAAAALTIGMTMFFRSERRFYFYL